ncbi:type VI secretion system-associated FHA domain protein TagH [Luteimonas sp. Y-2-2-4F]|nr:type VI secretion system-associated FHA domain protein TagH [Luteimonas sp. Y-2-2-4F]MCD9033573.1 type VI secretion system-associated FHA domain protein TagH [Luteimonas sp. Y-2-2-4F]
MAGARAAPAGVRGAFEFRQRGGSIGRADECDWVLAAPGISRTHAMVRYLDGLYFVEDRSTNGLLLNGAPLARGEPATLGDGDRLQMDAFEIEVRLRDTDDAPAPVPAAVPATAAPAPLPAPAPAPAPRQAAPEAPTGVDDLLTGLGDGGELDPLRLFDAPAAAPSAPAAGEGWNHTPAAADHFRPPRPATPPALLPERWDLTQGDFAPPPPPAPAAGALPDLDALLGPAPAAPSAPSPPSAPIPPVAPMPRAAAAPDLDRILAIVVDGVMEVLRARAEIKNTFRLPVTIIQRSENNPLKFAATPDEAMRRLLQPDGAFLSGAAAFDDAFDDIRCHQMAMLAGMRAAFESLLFHFNPDRIEREADSAGRRAFGGKGRYWERYRERFEAESKDPDACFRQLFGDEFARAYEAQLARLKSARRARPGG